MTPLVPGRQYFGLSWGAGGILASRFDGASRDVVLVDPSDGTERPLAAGMADERDPVADGEGGFLFSSDRTGIFNIYHRGLDGRLTRITNTIGGAFAPRIVGDDLLFTAYGDDGFEIRRLDGWRSGSVAVEPGEDDAFLVERRRRCIAAPSGCLGEAARDSLAVSYTHLTLPTKRIV